MKSDELSIGTSKRPKGEGSTAAPASGDQLATEEVHVDPTVAVDPAGVDDTANPTVTPPLSLRAMMETLMTTQTAHGQLIDKLLIEVDALRANSVFKAKSLGLLQFLLRFLSISRIYFLAFFDSWLDSS